MRWINRARARHFATPALSIALVTIQSEVEIIVHRFQAFSNASASKRAQSSHVTVRVFDDDAWGPTDVNDPLEVRERAHGRARVRETRG